MSGNISGTILFNGIGIPNVTVSDGVDPAVLTASDGTYTIPSVADGTYTVVPDLFGWIFDPESQQVVVSGSNVTGVDFTASKELIRQKVILDQTSGFSGYYIIGNTAIDATTGDILAASGAMISGYSIFGINTSSGFSGYSGVSGFSGNDGQSGQSGFSGASGASGTSGFSGFSGFNSSAGVVYFLHNESSDVAGEKELLTDAPDQPNVDLPFVISADTFTVLQSWVTQPGEPGTGEWSKGEYRLDFVAWKTNATEAEVFFNVYRRDGASRTLLGTSFATPNLTTVPTHYMVSWQNPDDIAVAATSRFEIELEAIDVGGGGTQTVHIGIEGNAGDSTDYASHVHTGVISAFGTSGKSGTSGFSGESGFSGISGNSGYSGSSGSSGASGDSGASGTSGATGDSGTSGYSGFSGDSGLSGFSGFSGASGLSGFSGFSADSGVSGFSGASGYSGFSGYSGVSGYSGNSGFSGYSGASGTSGISGFSGFSSQSGTSGFSGFSGASGYSGASGLSGTSGYSGVSGYSGFSAATFSALKYIFLDIQGGVDDVNVAAVTQMPYLNFTKTQARARWTVFVPADWITGTNMNIDIFWTPSDNTAGNVFLFTEAKAVAIGGSVSGANMTNTLVQASPGIAYQLTNTGSQLFISGASMAQGDLIQAVIGRSGNAGTDTYHQNVQVHHVRLEYLAKMLK